jgi:hypothetical protein
MKARMKVTGNKRKPAGRFVLLAIVLTHGSVFAADSAQQLASLVQQSTILMSEDHRNSTRKIVVLPGMAPATGAVTR